MHIYFAVQCHNYQRRLCWQLSSIVQQRSFDEELTIEVASMPDNGDPTTEQVVLAFHAGGLNVTMEPYFAKERFAKRGYVRSDQIQRAADAGADWIFFADCDNVYHPDFFADLVHRLYQRDPIRCGVFGCENKVHTKVDETNVAVDRRVSYIFYVADAFESAAELPSIHKGSRNIAAGGMQVVGVKAAMAAGGVYVPEGESKDRDMMQDGQKARSDIQFRKRMGGSIMLDLPLQIHLNHRRDKEEGRHLEIQR